MKRISKNKQDPKEDDRLIELLTDIAISKKTTTEESIQHFRQSIETAVSKQVALYGVEIMQKMGCKTVQDQVLVYNSAVARFMRDHCRALAARYHEVLYKSSDSDIDDIDDDVD